MWSELLSEFQLSGWLSGNKIQTLSLSAGRQTIRYCNIVDHFRSLSTGSLYFPPPIKSFIFRDTKKFHTQKLLGIK